MRSIYNRLDFTFQEAPPARRRPAGRTETPVLSQLPILEEERPARRPVTIRSHG